MCAERKLLAALRRECRGIVFDKEGNILRRPYHKFFNLNERDETQFSQVDLSKPHSILEKLDGSMIVPYRVNGRIVWGTKMGDTEVASPVHQFVADNPQYVEFFEACEIHNLSPIFEWMSRKQRIVIDHPVDRLVLTAIRNINTGQYLSYDEMKVYADVNGIEVVNEFPVEGKSIEEICDYVRVQPDTEGVVIRFDDGHMLKLKTDDYVRIHKAKDAILKERNVVDLIINEKLDDVMAMLPEEDHIELEKYQTRLLAAMNKTVTDLDTLVHKMQMTFATNKEYALSSVKKTHGRFAQRCVFQFLERRELDDLSLWRAIYQFYIKGLVRVNLNNDTKFREMKQEAFPNVRFIQNQLMN
jgi:RNA ligase